MQTAFARFILSSPRRLAMPIGVYAGLGLTGDTVIDVVTCSEAQAKAQRALHERFGAPFLLTAMDLSVEAEAFGSEIRLSETEIPTVIGRRVTNLEEIQALSVPMPGEQRTRVYLDAARRLVAERQPGEWVLGGLIGPFSLAGRLFGVSEMLELTITEPEAALALVGKAAAFLQAYAQAFKETGVDGVIMAEPAAGLLSPRALGKFSSPLIRQIVAAVEDERFALVLHNCGARLAHLPMILQAGAGIYHFGAPMDLPAALAQVSPQVVLAGNLDPAALFHGGTSADVRLAARSLLEATRGYPNYVASSGCDLPPGVSLDNLAAFYETVAAEGAPA